MEAEGQAKQYVDIEQFEELRQVRHGLLLEQKRAPRSTMLNASFGCGDSMLATASSDKCVRVFEVGTWKEALKIDHPDWVRDSKFSADGSVLATACDDKTLRMFDVEESTFWHPKEITSHEHRNRITCIAWHPFAPQFATACWDKVVRVFGPPYTPTPEPEPDPDEEVEPVDASNQEIAVGDTLLVIKDCTGGPDADDCGKLEKITPFGDLIVEFEKAGTKRIKQSDRVKLRKEDPFAIIAQRRAFWQAMMANSDGTRPSEVGKWQVHMAYEHTHGVNWVEYSPDGLRICTACSDHHARVYDLETQEELYSDAVDEEGVKIIPPERILKVFRATDAVEMVSFSPDGLQMCSASRDGKARIYDLETGLEVAEFRHGNVVNTVRFMPSWGDQLLVTSCNDGTARVYDVRGGTMPKIFRPGDQIRAANFSKDGTLLCLPLMDGSVRVYGINPDRPPPDAAEAEADVPAEPGPEPD